MPYRDMVRPRGPTNPEDIVETSGVQGNPGRDIAGLELILKPMGSFLFNPIIASSCGRQD